MWYLPLIEFCISIFEKKKNSRHFSHSAGEFPAGFQQAGHKGCHTSNSAAKI